MSYLVFYSANEQRKRRFVPSDEIRVARTYLNPCHPSGKSAQIHISRKGWVSVAQPVVFDASTTPPTLIQDSLNQKAYFAARNKSVPATYIDAAGSIRDLSGAVVMEGPS